MTETEVPAKTSAEKKTAKPIWHCANDMFLLCSEEPDWEEKPHEVRLSEKATEGFEQGGKCKLDPKTCGKSMALSEQYKPGDLPAGNTYRKKTTASGEKSKKKGKKKEESEQAKLF